MTFKQDFFFCFSQVLRIIQYLCVSNLQTHSLYYAPTSVSQNTHLKNYIFCNPKHYQHFKKQQFQFQYLRGLIFYTKTVIMSEQRQFKFPQVQQQAKLSFLQLSLTLSATDICTLNNLQKASLFNYFWGGFHSCFQIILRF